MTRVSSIPSTSRRQSMRNENKSDRRISKRELTSFPPPDFEIETSQESYVAAEISSSIRSLECQHEALLKANADGDATTFLRALRNYEDALIQLRSHLTAVHFTGREHLLRDVAQRFARYQDAAFQRLVSAWIGTPGVAEKWKNIQQHWESINTILTPPSNEAALRQLVEYVNVQRERRKSVAERHNVTGQGTNTQQQDLFNKEEFPSVINFNVAQSGAEATADQKSLQELRQELQLAQVMEMAVSQEQRFKALLKDLNSSAAELLSNIDQAQNAKQEVVDASQTSRQVVTELKAQNEVAQQITSEIRRDRGLSRSLLTACAALALCLSLPKLSFLLPLLKHLPGIHPHATTLQRALQRTTPSANIVANLVRERHMYRILYETINEVADIRQSGNLIHKIAFGMLGLGRVIDSRLEKVSPPSDHLDEHERWIDSRTTPYGPPQWTKTAFS